VGKSVSATRFSCFKYHRAPLSSYRRSGFVKLNFRGVAAFVHSLAAQADAGGGTAAAPWAALRLSEGACELGWVHFAWLPSPLPRSAAVRGQ